MRRRLLLTLLVAVACTAAAPASSPTSSAAVLVGAGDISSCANDYDESTAKVVEEVLAANPDAQVFTLGDNVYASGTQDEFTRCYMPTWGRFLDKTHPAAGNHDYVTRDAAAYYKTFGKAAGDPERGYYSWDIGGWHVVVLNSNCRRVGGCGEGSAQLQWLKDDLARHPSRCTLAYWHHPRFSSGLHGDGTEMAPAWRVLQAAGAELVLSGHDHHYERFGPLDADGNIDPQHGLRSFVVGNGGASLYDMPRKNQGTEVRHNHAYGVLELFLEKDGWRWKFLPAGGVSFTDEGRASCH